MFNLIFAKDLKYFSIFKPSSNIIVGHESIVTDFVVMMTKKPGSDLPNKFTICTSVFIELIMPNIIQILNEDGTPWFSISYQTRSSTNEVFFYCIQTGKY